MSPSIRGHFLWHELLTSNTDAAKPFYRKVVGWNPAPSKVPSYTEWMAGKVPMGGLMSIPADVKAMGVPPHWATYIGTDDVDATLRQAQLLGARVLKDVMAVPEVGRFAVVQDPQGAVFTAYTPSTAGIPTYPAPVGGFSWNELATTDWQAAWTFYSALFGWEKGQGMDMGPMGIYQIFQWNGVMLGAMFNKPPEIPVPNWLPYARVKNTTTAAAAVKAAGGQVINGPMDVPGGSIVQLLDPQGAVFAVHAVVEAVAAAVAAPAKKATTAKAKKLATRKPAKKQVAKKSAKKRAAKKPARKAPRRKAKKSAGRRKARRR